MWQLPSLLKEQTAVLHRCIEIQITCVFVAILLSRSGGAQQSWANGKCLQASDVESMMN